MSDMVTGQEFFGFNRREFLGIVRAHVLNFVRQSTLDREDVVAAINGRLGMLGERSAIRQQKLLENC